MTVTLKLGQGQKFCSQTVAQGKIFGYTKFCLATLKTVSEVDPRLGKKRKRGLSQPTQIVTYDQIFPVAVITMRPVTEGVTRVR